VRRGMVEWDSVLNIAWRIGLVIPLVMMSQMFTGLNIGLLALDTVQLQVLIDVPNKDEKARRDAKYARMIMPVRKRGNLLLCTILLGNTAVNSLMAILLTDFAGGTIGFVVTTLLIVFFCEITPQSVCTRHGLMLGAYGSWIIRVAIVLFYPVTKPYAIILDFLFPQRENMLDRGQMRSLVEYQKAAMPGMLAAGQAEMLIGALGFASMEVTDVMVPMETAFKIFLDTTLDYKLVSSVVQKGYTRFPILDRQTMQVESILHCKDFLTHDFSTHLSLTERSDDAASQHVKPKPLQTAGEFLEEMRKTGRDRSVLVCTGSLKLLGLLNELKTHMHLAVVADTDEAGKPDKTKPHIGIVTLQNIFETILQSDKNKFSERVTLRSPQALCQAGAVKLLDRHFADDSPGEINPLGEPEMRAVLTFLRVQQAPFTEGHLCEEFLVTLLRELRPVRVTRDTVLYKRNEKADRGTLILQGAVKIISGEESMESSIGPWSCLAMRSLEPPTSLIHTVRHTEGEELLELHDAHDYIPDFTALTLTTTLMLQIQRIDYLKAYHASHCKRVRSR